jgi:hypothetical protein
MTKEITFEGLYQLIKGKRIVGEIELRKHLDRTEIEEYKPVQMLLEKLVESGHIIKLDARTKNVLPEWSFKKEYMKAYYIAGPNKL